MCFMVIWSQMKSTVSNVHCTIYTTVQMIMKVIQAAMSYGAASTRPDSSASSIFC